MLQSLEEIIRAELINVIEKKGLGPNDFTIKFEYVKNILEELYPIYGEVTITQKSTSNEWKFPFGHGYPNPAIEFAKVLK